MTNNGIQEEQNGAQKTSRQSYLVLITIVLILIITAIIFYPEVRQQIMFVPSETAPPVTATPFVIYITVVPTPEPTEVPVEQPSPTAEVFAQKSQFGSLVLSLREGNDIHLFSYRPFLENSTADNLTALPLTRITTGSHQDITPAISPDGTKIAFSSNRDGPWDLYILDLVTGETTRFTNTRAYDGNPTWSPDGKWLAYESYQLNNLDLFIQDINQNGGPIPLTSQTSADYSPNWSGGGRKIGYVSTRSGQKEIWYIDLDSSEADKAVRVPGSNGESIDHPTWSSDGRFLSWSDVTSDGQHILVTWDSTKPDNPPAFAGQGDWPIWGGEGEILFSVIFSPNKSYLTAYAGQLEDVQLMLPAIHLPGVLEGISWARDITINSSLEWISEKSPSLLWETLTYSEGQKADLTQVPNLDAPNPQLIKNASNTFSSLRQRIRENAGWDLLSTLESAYTPIDKQIMPGIDLNWVYTGRGMLINDIPRLADWLIVVRENYPEKTFWRVYIKANNQQGYQGKPIKSYP
jgi:TolB protein